MLRVHAHVRPDKLEIIEEQDFKKFLRNRVWEIITLDIEQVRSIRSLQENRYYFWVVIKILSEYFGYTPEEMHEVLKTAFLTKKLRMKHDKRRKLTMIRSTTTLTTLEFEEYLEKVRLFARGFNVYIPLPNEEV